MTSMKEYQKILKREAEIERLYEINLAMQEEMIKNWKKLDKKEIIEDKKIEKIPIGKYHPTHRIKKIENKINEIIDYLEENKEC